MRFSGPGRRLGAALKWLTLAMAVGACGESNAEVSPHPDVQVVDLPDAEVTDHAVVGLPQDGNAVTADRNVVDDRAVIDPGDGALDGRALDDRTARPDSPAPGDASDGSTPIDGSMPPRDGAPTGPVTIEALQVIGTHNSYHVAPLIAFDNSHKYTQVPLDQQFAGGVRAIEIDVHQRSAGVFDVYHISIIDPNSTCATLDECLGVVATWSNGHPRHTPIFIWFEIKDDTGGQMITDVASLEPVISKVFAREKIITPAWLKGNYASPRERIVKAGWPTVDETRGKVMFALIDRDARTQAYSHDFTSLDDRLMFVNPTAEQYSLPWAAITKIDDSRESAAIGAALAAHLIVASNICAANQSDDECQMRLSAGISNGVHMLHDDLPFPVSGRTYSAKLPGGSPGCNPVTAPASCATRPLE